MSASFWDSPSPNTPAPVNKAPTAPQMVADKWMQQYEEYIRKTLTTPSVLAKMVQQAQAQKNAAMTAAIAANPPMQLGPTSPLHNPYGTPSEAEREKQLRAYRRESAQAKYAKAKEKLPGEIASQAAAVIAGGLFAGGLVVLGIYSDVARWAEGISLIIGGAWYVTYLILKRRALAKIETEYATVLMTEAD